MHHQCLTSCLCSLPHVGFWAFFSTLLLGLCPSFPRSGFLTCGPSTDLVLLAFCELLQSSWHPPHSQDLIYCPWASLRPFNLPVEANLVSVSLCWWHLFRESTISYAITMIISSLGGLGWLQSPRVRKRIALGHETETVHLVFLILEAFMMDSLFCYLIFCMVLGVLLTPSKSGCKMAGKKSYLVKIK